jgi:hypothetical protein
MKKIFLITFLISLFSTNADQTLLCSDYNEGSIICEGDVFFQSNLIGEKQASCYRNSNGDFNCERYHENTLICADGDVYLSSLSDHDLMNCLQVNNPNRSTKEAINQALMEAAIDHAVREAANR